MFVRSLARKRTKERERLCPLRSVHTPTILSADTADQLGERANQWSAVLHGGVLVWAPQTDYFLPPHGNALSGWTGAAGVGAGGDAANGEPLPAGMVGAAAVGVALAPCGSAAGP